MMPHRDDSLPEEIQLRAREGMPLQRSFHRSRSEQVADYLRGCIARGELLDPLPGTRAWCASLGVSRSTLDFALEILQREGFLRLHPRKSVQLRHRKFKNPLLQDLPPRRARFVFYRQDYPEHADWLNWIAPLSELLAHHRIRISLERCDATRLHRLSSQTRNPNELFFLLSLPSKYQRAFDRSGSHSILLGYPANGIALPYVCCDVVGAVRHAANRLMRHGISNIMLLVTKAGSPGLELVSESFLSACREWPTQPVRARVLRIPLELEELLQAASLFASRAVRPQGVIVISPVPIGMFQTILLQRGFSIPDQAAFSVVANMPESIKLWPVPNHYPFPIKKLLKTIVETAIQFFETGRPPTLRKSIPLELA